MRLGRWPKNIIADAAYGSEENYAFVERHQLGNYLKYNTFHQDQIQHRKPELVRKQLFRAENFPYDELTDTFTCPNHQRLTFLRTLWVKSDNGYLAERREYACAECAGCPLRAECTKAKDNRHIRVSFRLQAFREQARQNLTSELGEELRGLRSVEVETVFGQIKHNLGVRRFLLRGKQKVHNELGLLCLGHNLRKVWLKQQMQSAELAQKRQKLAA